MWANNTGVARAFDNDGVIRFGLVGSADILGITSDGHFLAIEVKTGDAVQSVAQIKFMVMIRAFYGRYRVVYSVEEAIGFLNSLMLEPVDI